MGARFEWLSPLVMNLRRSSVWAPWPSWRWGLVANSTMEWWARTVTAGLC